MSSIQVDKGSAAKVQRSGIAAFKQPLQQYLNIVRSSRSPYGCIKVLQSVNGGNTVLTTSSKRIFSNLSVKTPVIKLLVSATQGHLDAYSDCGLFLSSLAADLILKSINCDLSGKFLSECYEQFLTLCLEYLNRDEFHVKYSAILSNLTFMQSFVKTVLMSKPLCGFNDERLNYLSHLMIDIFLNCISDCDQGKHIADSIFVITYSGKGCFGSEKVTGLLIPAPEFSQFHTQCIQPIQVNNDNNIYIKVALIENSLSGDLDEVSDMNFEVTTDFSVDSAVLEQLTYFCEILVRDNVGLVLCQRVIHPKLKASLRKSGVIVVDRVGSYPMKYIISLTGCQPIQSVNSSIPSSCYGYITDLKHEIRNSQSYLLLTKEKSPVLTLLLCHNQEEVLNELKDVCMTCIDSLQQLLYKPYVLAGGGCWQAGLAAHLRNKVFGEIEDLSVQLEVPVSTIRAACDIFCDSLIGAGVGDRLNIVIDSATGHVCTDKVLTETVDNTAQHCSCRLYKISDTIVNDLRGFPDSAKYATAFLDNVIDVQEVLKSRSTVLDAFSPAVNAFQTAILSACTVLKIGQVVENV